MFLSEKQYIHPKLGEVTITKKMGVKYLRLRVNANSKLLVTVPYGVTFNAAIEFIEKKIEWILKQQLALREKRERENLKLSNIESILLINKRRIRLYLDSSSTEIRIIKDDKAPFDIGIRYPPNRPEEDLFEAFTEILRQEARSYLPCRVQELANMHGFKYNSIYLKNNVSNWGSCSSKKNINLNIHLMRIDPEVADFIMLHELCHLIHPNHGRDFHNLLNRLCHGKELELRLKIPKRIR